MNLRIKTQQINKNAINALSINTKQATAPNTLLYARWLLSSTLLLGACLLYSGCTSQETTVRYDDYPYSLKDVRDWDIGSVFDSGVVTMRAGNEAEGDEQSEPSAMYEESGLRQKNSKQVAQKKISSELPRSQLRQSSVRMRIAMENNKQWTAPTTLAQTHQSTYQNKASNDQSYYYTQNSGHLLKNAIWDAMMIKVGNMPILSANQQAGVISTDWFMDVKDKKHKYKLTITLSKVDEKGVPSNYSQKVGYIAKHIQVSLFKLQMQGSVWVAVRESEKAITSARMAIAENAARIYDEWHKKS